MSYMDEIYGRSEGLFPEDYVTSEEFVEHCNPDTLAIKDLGCFFPDLSDYMDIEAHKSFVRDVARASIYKDQYESSIIEPWLARLFASPRLVEAMRWWVREVPHYDDIGDVWWEDPCSRVEAIMYPLMTWSIAQGKIWVFDEHEGGHFVIAPGEELRAEGLREDVARYTREADELERVGGDAKEIKNARYMAGELEGHARSIEALVQVKAHEWVIDVEDEIEGHISLDGLLTITNRGKRVMRRSGIETLEQARQILDEWRKSP